MLLFLIHEVYIYIRRRSNDSKNLKLCVLIRIDDMKFFS